MDNEDRHRVLRTVWMPPQLDEQLHVLAFRRQKTKSDVIVESLKEVFDRPENQIEKADRDPTNVGPEEEALSVRITNDGKCRIQSFEAKIISSRIGNGFGHFELIDWGRSEQDAKAAVMEHARCLISDLQVLLASFDEETA